MAYSMRTDHIHCMERIVYSIHLCVVRVTKREVAGRMQGERNFLMTISCLVQMLYVIMSFVLQTEGLDSSKSS